MTKRTAKEAVKRALAEVGNVENPAGSNRTPYGKAYGMDGNAWCAMFVWWVVNHGATSILPKTAYTPTLWNWAKAQGILRDPDYKAKAGDLVLFQFPSLDRINHVGMVVKDRANGSDALVCVEGNTSGSDPRNGGMVAGTKRKSYVRGIVDMSGLYGKPTENTPKTPPKPTYALTRLLERGCKGDDVEALQRAVDVKVDGVFGAITESAVEAYQDNHKLTVDGIVGKATATSLGWSWEPSKVHKVRITGSSVIVRAGAGTNTKDTDKRVKRGEVHRISAEAHGEGANKWLRLASGSGWISGDFANKV